MWILLEVTAVIVNLDILAATARQVSDALVAYFMSFLGAV